MVEDEPAADAAFATRRYALIAGAVALVVAAASVGARAIGGRTTAPALAPVAESAPVSASARAVVTPPPDPPPVASAAPSPVERFEIVVASFHTISRANEIAAAVAALDQPVRQREAGGWQQVLAGPYASAAAARDAQQQLERAGFADTKIVPARIPSPESQIPSSLQF
jgi:cell division protein FtsN